MNRAFSSALAAELAAFIDFKHKIGVTFTTGEYYLWRLDEYCVHRGVTALTRAAVEGFVRDFERGNPDPDRTGLSYLRGFGRYLQARGNQDAYVLSERFGNARPRPVPYLLSECEIDAFFRAAATCDYTPPWSWQARAFFGLMLACGLRTCEMRRLRRADVDLAGGAIDVLWSKGPRSRRLPITEDVARLLAICDRRNDTFAPGRVPFFLSGWKNGVSGAAPGVVFKRLWLAAGLAMPMAGPSPAPYAFRHHFAYANIDRWTARGDDPVAMMPYLARYMGHASTESTYYYLHVSPDFIAGYAENFAASARLLPQVGFDE